MAHIGFAVLCVPGHLYPASTLAAHLKTRGHRVTFFTIADGVEFLTKAGFECATVGKDNFPLGYVKRVTEELGHLKGRRGLAFTIQTLCNAIEGTVTDAPAAIREAGVNALVLDQFEMTGSTLAEHLQLPYVHLANALIANTEASVPPFTVGWGIGGGPLALLRNRTAHALTRRLMRPVRERINAQRRAWGLQPFGEFINERFGRGPQISQQPPGFEFPRRELPTNFHFVGPLHSLATRTDTAFPWERLDGRPLIYASMGTLQNRLAWAFRAIAEGCATLNAQLVLSLGGALDPTEFAGLPGDPIVVRYAPQLMLLQRAAVCITHAGLNTVLESLTHGVPMMAIPVTNDQPGVAARLRWTGSGEVVPLKKLNAAAVTKTVSNLLTNSRYGDHARKLQAEIGGLQPLQRASEIVESVVT